MAELELLYYENGRPVYRNKEVPHEEDRNVFCPNVCKFKNSCWKNSCIENNELEDVKAVGQLCFNRKSHYELTPQQVIDCVKKYFPSYSKIDGVTVNYSHLQLIWYDNICPVSFIRDAIGNDLDCIEDLTFRELEGFIGYSLFFECHDLEKAELIKNKYLDIVNNYTDGKAEIKIETFYYDNNTTDTGDDFMFFYFELADREFIKGIYNFCNELDLEVAFNRFTKEEDL